MPDVRSAISLILTVSAGLIAAAFLSVAAERNRVTLPDGYADGDLMFQGKQLKGYALGAEGMLADAYWMASLQYIGDKLFADKSETINLDDLRPLNPRLLAPYLENATDLDPRFLAAFYYGAVVLPAIDPEKAIALTEKGIAANPVDWRLYQYLGYIYWRLKNFEKAAEVYDKGAAIAGAPAFMKMMSAAMRTRGGDRETARAIYTQMYDEAGDSQSRDNAKLRLDELDSLDERDAIGVALDGFRKRSGRCALSFAEIFPYLRNAKPASGKSLRVSASGAINDPTGSPYVLDIAACRAVLSPDSRIPKS